MKRSSKPKIFVSINLDNGVESVTIDATNNEGRQVGYNACAVLEPTFMEITRIVLEMQKEKAEQ